MRRLWLGLVAVGLCYGGFSLTFAQEFEQEPISYSRFGMLPGIFRYRSHHAT